MPAAAVAMLSGQGVEAVEARQQEVLTAYALDFAKHAVGSDITRIAAIWQSIPSQLARENRKFLYRLVKPGARAREYEDALLWLEHAGLIHRIFCTTKPVLPLSAYDDVSAFKIYLSDAGLLRRLAQLPAEVFTRDVADFTEFKGAMTENWILQSLLHQWEVTPRYWTSGATAEVDFIVQAGVEVLPVEVKAGTNVRARSLAVYADRYQPRLALRFSMNNLCRDARLLNLPVFMADWSRKILESVTL